MVRLGSKTVCTTESGYGLFSTMQHTNDDAIDTAKLRYRELCDLLYRVRETITYVITTSREEYYSQASGEYERVFNNDILARLARLLVELDDVRDDLEGD